LPLLFPKVLKVWHYQRTRQSAALVKRNVYKIARQHCLFLRSKVELTRIPKGERKMINRRKLLSLLGVSPALLATSASGDQHKKDAAPSATTDPKFTALTPKGTPPPVQLYSMAPRAASLDGKTIYLVDATSFDGSETLLRKMQAWFQQNMPTVKTVFRKKAGVYAEDDPKLWAEIKANSYAAIMAIGH
jgi:hypothetical protein